MVRRNNQRRRGGNRSQGLRRRGPSQRRNERKFCKRIDLTSTRADMPLETVLATGNNRIEDARLTAISLECDGTSAGLTRQLILHGPATGDNAVVLGTIRTGSMPVTRRFTMPARVRNYYLNIDTPIDRLNTVAGLDGMQGVITFHFISEAIPIYDLGDAPVDTTISYNEGATTIGVTGLTIGKYYTFKSETRVFLVERISQTNNVELINPPLTDESVTDLQTTFFPVTSAVAAD